MKGLVMWAPVLLMPLWYALPYKYVKYSVYELTG